MWDAKPILMVAERTVLTSLKEAAASRVATAIHWETVKYWDKEVAEKDRENRDLSLSSLSKEVADDANVVDSSKVAYEPRLGDLEIPNTLKSEIKRYLQQDASASI